MAKRKNKSQLMVPEASKSMQEMRYEIAKRMGFIDVAFPEEEWWERMTPMQQSKVNGQVTKLLITKAQYDMVNGTFKH